VSEQGSQAKAVPALEWSDSLSVSVRQMDEQHKKLVEAINELSSKLRHGSSEEELTRTIEEIVYFASDNMRLEEEMMRKSEERYRLLFNSNDAILVHEFHDDGSAEPIVEVNDITCKSLEYTREELLQMGIDEITPREARTVDPAMMQRLRAEGHLVYESIHLSKSGRKFPVEISNRLFELNGKPMNFSTIRDITERKHAELALKQEATRRRILFEEAKDGIVVLGQDLKVVEANQSFKNMLGYSPEEIHQLHVWDWDVFYPTEKLLREKWPEPPAARGTFESRHRRKDGSVYDVEISQNSAQFPDEVQMYCICRDITQRKRLEESLEKERALLLTLINNLPDYFSVKDIDNRFLIADTAKAHVMGLERAQDAVGKTDLDFYPPSEAGRYLADERTIIQVGTALINKEEESIDTVCRKLWTLTTKVPLRDAQGRIVADLNLRPTYISPSVEKLSGYTVQEVMELSLAQVLTPESLQKVNLVFAEQMALEASGRGDPSRTFLLELEEYCKDGSAKWVDLAGSFLRDSNLKATGILTVTRDITKRKQAEAARQLLASAVEQAAEMVVITDAAAAIEYVNPAFETITGYSRQEVVGHNPRFLKSGEQDAAFYASLWQAISSGKTWTGRLVNKKKDGSRYTENVTISPVHDSAGAIRNYVAVKRDITRELQLEDQLRQAQKMESIGRLTGGIAHDFNNILLAITGYCELLTAGVSGKNREFAAEITKAAERATTLIAQLLAFSRKQILRPRVVETNVLIRSMQKMLERLIGEHIELQTFIDPNTSNFMADPGQMEQVLMNLAVNARDAMPSGGKLTIETSNRTFDDAYVRDHPESKAGQYVRIAVSDTGVGMGQETISHIFEPFFTTKGLGRGTGLGLSTVYGVVEQSGGYINCYSEPGKGTTFTIYLPVALLEADKPANAVVATRALRGTETVLLVDDDSAVRSVARIALQNAGYVVIEASAGEAALSDVLARKIKVELLVTDVVMPRMSGKELALKLSQTCPRARVLYISGYTENAISHNGILEANTDYLQKPFGSTELLTKVREVLDRP